jgi:ATP-dependent RNA helicase DDX5/DBP2
VWYTDVPFNQRNTSTEVGVAIGERRPAQAAAAHHHAAQQSSIFEGEGNVEDRSALRTDGPKKEGSLPASSSSSPSERSCVSADVQQDTVHVVNHRGAAFRVQPIRRFSDVAEDLPQWLNQGIASMGYEKPTAVQSYAIPLLMEAKDVVGIAPTGSGKTVAFAIPALSTVDITKRRRMGRSEPSILVLCPTRELTQQTKSVFVALGGGQVITRAVFGGQDRDEQRKFLSHGSEALIATPGRLCDFLDTGDISLEHVDFFVLDEADRMLEMGFAPQLKHIMKHLTFKEEGEGHRRRVTMMWSATWSKTVEQLASGLLHPTERLTVTVEQASKMNQDIVQHTYGVQDPSEKLHKMVHLYESGKISALEKVIVFANHKDTVETIAADMVTALRVADRQLIQGLHGGMRQPKRDAIMRKFRSGEVRVLVATDVAARGLDVPDIEHVVNYDLPTEIDRYVHRIGRTGRAGRKGMSHTFFCRHDAGLGADLADFLVTNNVILSDEAAAVVQGSRFGRDRHYFQRYDTGSKPITPMSNANLSEDAPENDWRHTQESTRHAGTRGSMGGHHRHGGGRGGRRPLRVITLKRDA